MLLLQGAELQLVGLVSSTAKSNNFRIKPLPCWLKVSTLWLSQDGICFNNPVMSSSCWLS